MEEFNVWELVTDAQDAHKEVADRVETIKRLYQECVSIAEVFGMRVSIDMGLDEQYRQGHNGSSCGQELYWSASAQHC